MSENIAFIILLLLPSITLLIFFLKFYKNKEKKNSNLLGSRGFPLIGKTLSLFKPHPPNTMGRFMEDQISKYGKISSSSILGREAIISADGELNQFVMKNNMGQFVSAWLPAFGEIVGRDSVVFAVGENHKKIRSHIVNCFNMRRLQSLFLKDADHFASAMMRSWLDGSIISAKTEAIKKVINETLRVSNIASFILKKIGIHDVQYKDIILPQGSLVVLNMTAVHLDSSLYDNPSQFNPWRWLDPSCVTKRAGSFMPFGGGAKMCPGANLAKLEMAIFLHHLVLNFHWGLAEPLDQPLSQPYLEFPKGLPIKIRAAMHPKYSFKI
ncbi:Cytochrome P450 90B1 [Apostasia shenzhenica]|uniref:Cytochrome P450 90B1 n=1 Tax=Apostasia shenzhenica TaxID=1088818 RepID=A0A2I0AHM4_9ASPA|nr:Cytochrome P450 90B1 [Apostasia shenzhenica]